MKQGRNTSITKNNAGEVVAINLGVDYYFEHEHGIAPLNECLGVVDRKISKGVDLIATNLNTPGIVYFYKGKRYTLWGLSANYTDRTTYWRDKIQREYFNLEREPICSFWDSRSFLFMTEDKKLIEDFYKAFTENDIKIWASGSETSNNGGLTIAIESRLSNSNADTVLTPQDTLSDSDLRETSMTLGEFIQKFSHNNIIRLWYAERTGNKPVLENYNGTSMDWQVLYQQGPYRHFINNKVIKLTTCVYHSSINVRHPEALNIVIEKLQDQPYLEEIPDEGFNVVRSEAAE